MTCQQGPTLSDTKGRHRLQKLQERCQHITEQIAELRDKRKIMQYEAWCVRAELAGNPVTRMLCGVMIQCYR